MATSCRGQEYCGRCCGVFPRRSAGVGEEGGVLCPVYHPDLLFLLTQSLFCPWATWDTVCSCLGAGPGDSEHWDSSGWGAGWGDTWGELCLPCPLSSGASGLAEAVWGPCASSDVLAWDIWLHETVSHRPCSDLVVTLDGRRTAGNSGKPSGPRGCLGQEATPTLFAAGQLFTKQPRCWLQVSYLVS